MLSRQLAESGHYPAIDIEASISRAMSSLITPEYFEQVRGFKQLYSRYQRSRDLISVGAYSPGSDSLLDRAILLHPQLEAFLQQGMFEQAGYTDSAAKLGTLLAS